MFERSHLTYIKVLYVTKRKIVVTLKKNIKSLGRTRFVSIESLASQCTINWSCHLTCYSAIYIFNNDHDDFLGSPIVFYGVKRLKSFLYDIFFGSQILNTPIGSFILYFYIRINCFLDLMVLIQALIKGIAEKCWKVL